MSIYDVADLLIKNHIESVGVADESEKNLFQKLLNLIDEDDSYEAERIRSVIQIHINEIDSFDENIEDDIDDFEPEEDDDITEVEAATESPGYIDNLACEIIDRFALDIEENPSLENIKAIVFDDLEDEYEHNEVLDVAHRVFEMIHN